jgi:large subunit ribosomal protein L1
MAEAKKTDKEKSSADSKKKQVKHAEVVAEVVPADKVPEVQLEVKPEKPGKANAKAGKRSAKSVIESEQKQAKEIRKKTSSAEQQPNPTAATKPARSRADRAGKKYREMLKLVDKSKTYPLAEALDLAAKTSPTKFDGTIEMHINLGVDPKQADQNVRDSLVLPAGTGKNIRVAVIDDDASAENLFAKLDKENVDFDVLIATPAMMPKLGKYARLLGPRGLMPNPKSGTVTTEVKKAEAEAKAGRVEYRVDQAGIIHLGIGKASFGGEKLLQNAEALMVSVRAARPAGLKGIYIKSAYVTATMGPSVKIEI